MASRSMCLRLRAVVKLQRHALLYRSEEDSSAEGHGFKQIPIKRTHLFLTKTLCSRWRMSLPLWFAQNRSSRYRAEVRRVLTLLLPKF
jgi:hypothetical protein